MSELKNKIKQTDDTKWQTVDLPEWGCSLQVRNATHAEKIAWELSIASKGKDGRIKFNRKRSMFNFVAALTFEEGSRTPFFTADDYEWVAAKSSAPVQRLFDAAAALSGIGENDQKELFENLD